MNKIQRIISELKDNIINTFSNSEIFDIFKCNKNILLYLIKKSILTIDKAIADQILEKSDTKYPKYHLFFASEIKQFVDFDMWSDIENELLRYNSQIFENFEINRQNGENESFICSLIRDDSVEEFISYVNRTNISFSSQIKTSIFETNSFLLKKKEPTLIEYAAFYGSIQIFQYLRLNNAKLMPSLWLYAIHGRNPELIHLLEESGVEPNDKTYEECLKMAIKCHHNDIANYIKENLLDEKIEISNLEHNYDENIVAYSFRYMNYDFMPIDLNNKFFLHYSCHYNYFKLVEILMKTKKFPLNASIIHIINLFLIQFQIYSLFIELQNHFSFYFTYFYFTPLRLAAINNRNEIVQLLLSNPAIKITSNSLKNCSKLKEIKINETVTSIGNSAFENCSSLTEITIPSSIKSIGNFAFRNCSSLAEIEIPSSVKEIGESAFSECSSLTRITIPSSLNIIRHLTFYGCTSLKQITIPSSVRMIESSSFDNCSNLEKVNILSLLTSIEGYTFNYCSSLKHFKIPPSVISIGYWSFSGCSSLKEITIPSSVTKIDECAFMHCESLTKITIPSSVNQISASCFKNCTSLAQVTILSSVEKIKSSCFEGCSSLTKISIPSTVKKIGSSCFKGCSSLKQISIPSSVDFIGQHAFFECSSLVEIKIPSSLKEIESYTFYGCSSLNQVTIPLSVTKIGFSAFDKCSSLTQMSLSSSINSQFIGIGSNVKIIKI
ncbi:hypothetical protein M9Y10_001395 [Tritrichomonas musculus]|uniref:Uncharacterized protein n=1 Tax=Tritrichomonas musculus TaxID=1915356 RepID=A0ABR2L6V7_9EUKA